MSAECPICGKQMVKEYSNIVLTVNPPIHTFRWWCTCGARGNWEQERELTREEMLRRSWDAKNEGGA